MPAEPDTEPRWVAWYRVGFALLGLGNILFIIFHNRQTEPDWRLGNQLSFFTTESNIFGCALLLLAGLGLARAWPAVWIDYLRGAAAVYLFTTCIVDGALLAGTESASYVPWAGTIEHRLIPIVVIVDWLVVPPVSRLAFRRMAAISVAYPLIYLGYSLLRGPLAGWYPYAFVDPRRPGGWSAVIATCAGITLFILLVSWAALILGNAQRQARQAPPAAAGPPSGSGHREPAPERVAA